MDSPSSSGRLRHKYLEPLTISLSEPRMKGKFSRMKSVDSPTTSSLQSPKTVQTTNLSATAHPLLRTKQSSLDGSFLSPKSTRSSGSPKALRKISAVEVGDTGSGNPLRRQNSTGKSKTSKYRFAAAAESAMKVGSFKARNDYGASLRIRQSSTTPENLSSSITNLNNNNSNNLNGGLTRQGSGDSRVFRRSRSLRVISGKQQGKGKAEKNQVKDNDGNTSDGELLLESFTSASFRAAYGQGPASKTFGTPITGRKKLIRPPCKCKSCAMQRAQDQLRLNQPKITLNNVDDTIDDSISINSTSTLGADPKNPNCEFFGRSDALGRPDEEWSGSECSSSQGKSSSTTSIVKLKTKSKPNQEGAENGTSGTTPKKKLKKKPSSASSSVRSKPLKTVSSGVSSIAAVADSTKNGLNRPRRSVPATDDCSSLPASPKPRRELSKENRRSPSAVSKRKDSSSRKQKLERSGSLRSTGKGAEKRSGGSSKKKSPEESAAGKNKTKKLPSKYDGLFDLTRERPIDPTELAASVISSTTRSDSFSSSQNTPFSSADAAEPDFSSSVDIDDKAETPVSSRLNRLTSKDSLTVEDIAPLGTADESGRSDRRHLRRDSTSSIQSFLFVEDKGNGLSSARSQQAAGGGFDIWCNDAGMTSPGRQPSSSTATPGCSNDSDGSGLVPFPDGELYEQACSSRPSEDCDQNDGKMLSDNEKKLLLDADKERQLITSRMGSRNDNTSGSYIKWKRGPMLGRGAFGTVWCGLTITGELIAVKQSIINAVDMVKAQREYEKVQSEVDLLKSLNHPNIVAYLGTCLDNGVVSIFMQYVPGGSMSGLLRKFGALEEEVLAIYTRQVLAGIAYIHGKNIIHRDIKGSNIMLMPRGLIKVIDFGCAKRIMHLHKTNDDIVMSMKGTPYWMAPEVLEKSGNHATKSDVWSVGCTVFEMATAKPPWSHLNKYAALFAISQDSEPLPSLPASRFSKEARDFLVQCLKRNPSKRPEAEKLSDHSFIRRSAKDCDDQASGQRQQPAFIHCKETGLPRNSSLTKF